MQRGTNRKPSLVDPTEAPCVVAPELPVRQSFAFKAAVSPLSWGQAIAAVVTIHRVSFTLHLASCAPHIHRPDEFSLGVLPGELQSPFSAGLAQTAALASEHADYD